ncbi:MAG: sel1 repeat family protein [Alphaproteobacteria bacterium]|nr:sel1 repeat family protein [Alphaproteobacteria bacterium]
MLRIFLVLALISFLSSPAFAGFKEGKDAYNRKDWVEAITELRPLAESGDDRAMIILANMYNDGLGVAQSYKGAMSLYKRAAIEKNNTEAMIAIAAMHISGLGVSKNLNTALQWSKRAAQLGNQQGAFFCALILLRGNKSPTDDIQPDIYNSYKWFRIAAAEEQNPKFQQAAEKLAKHIADLKLTAEETAKADKETADWKPVDAASLGPVPADPVILPAPEQK